MPDGRYKKVPSRFRQWRVLPPDCKSWLESRPEDGTVGGGESGDSAGSGSASAAAVVAATSATGRMSGDLPENVTEERLFQSRLYDLARERHKMIQESDYVRNQFIDHQVRKSRSRSLGRLLQGMDIEQYRNKSASGVEKFHQRSAHARLMLLGARLLGLSIEELGKFSEEELRQRLNMPSSSPAAMANAAPSVTAAVNPAEGAAEAEEEPSPPQQPPPPPTLLLPPRPSTSTPGASTTAPRRSSIRPGSTISGLQLPRVGQRGQSSSYRAAAAGAARGSLMGGSSYAAAAAAAQSPDRRPRTASARRRVQSDPRCVQLLNTLTPRYKPAGKVLDVGAIIRANPSLFQPTEPPDPEQQELQQPRLQPFRQQQQQQRQKAAKGRRTRRELLEMLDNLVKTRYYEAGNLATLR